MVLLRGDQPVSEQGQTFTSNQWSWKPLMQYVEVVSPGIYADISFDVGEGLDPEKSRLLANILTAEIVSGRTVEYEEEYNERFEGEEFWFSEARVKLFRDFLRDCGGFSIS